MRHTDAREIVDGLGFTPAESLFIRGVACHETNYGAGWAKKGIGVNSHNWGAITRGGSPQPLDFRHDDSKFDHALNKQVTYTTWFRGYPGDFDGAKDLGKVLLKANVKAALAAGDLYGAVRAQGDNRYYLGIHKAFDDNVNDYYNAVSKCIAKILDETGEHDPFGGTPASGGEGSGVGKLFALAAAAALAVAAWKAWKA